MSKIHPPIVTNAKSLLTPGEVAKIMGVDPKTVTRWAKAGKLRSIRTMGGHRRFYEDDFRDLIRAKKG